MKLRAFTYRIEGDVTFYATDQAAADKMIRRWNRGRGHKIYRKPSASQVRAK